MKGKDSGNNKQAKAANAGKKEQARAPVQKARGNKKPFQPNKGYKIAQSAQGKKKELGKETSGSDPNRKKVRVRPSNKAVIVMTIPVGAGITL